MLQVPELLPHLFQPHLLTALIRGFGLGNFLEHFADFCVSSVASPDDAVARAACVGAVHLARTIGPVLTTRHITRVLLRMLSKDTPSYIFEV